MIAYQLYIQDDRYSVPTLCFLEAEHDLQAIDIARRKLAVSIHHRRIEIRCGDTYVGGCGEAETDGPRFPLYGRTAGY
jgi:hypothetical protein